MKTFSLRTLSFAFATLLAPTLSPAQTADVKPSVTLPLKSVVVKDMVVSPDNKFLACCGQLDHVVVWDIAAKKIAAVLKHGRLELDVVAFSPDGKMLIAANGVVTREPPWKIWEVGSWKELRTGGNDWGLVAFSQDSKSLYIATVRELSAWDVNTNKQLWGEKVRLKEYERATPWLSSFAVAPDRSMVALGTGLRVFDSEIRKCEVILIHAGSRKEILRHQHHELFVGQIVFSHDAKYLASVGREGNAAVYDIGAQKELLIQQVAGTPNCICFARDNRHLLVGLQDRGVMIINVLTGKIVGTFASGQTIQRMAVFEEGKKLATAQRTLDDGIQVWDLEAIMKTIDKAR
jgi:WD40 repeat protein